MVNDICVIGLGYIGKIHLKLLKDNSNWNLVGVYDRDKSLTKHYANQYGVVAFESLQEALDQTKVVDIVTPSHTHFEIASLAVMNGKHVFIEKPVTDDLKKAKKLQRLVQEAGVHLKVSNVERYNPAFIAALPYLDDARYIEVHRLVQYSARGTDVSVVLDLMTHDLDLILHIVNSNVKKIHVSGGAVVSRTADLTNARIEFENGSVANITTNRMAFKNSRKFRVFTPDNFVSVNLLDKTTEVIKIKNAGKNSRNLVIEPGNGLPNKEVIFEHPIILPTNAINDELTAFHLNINSNKISKDSLDEAIRVMELAFEIEEGLKL